MKIYILEENGELRNDYIRYRYRSLYNGAVGSWVNTKEKAINEGESHQKIIQEIVQVNFE